MLFSQFLCDILKCFWIIKVSKCVFAKENVRNYNEMVKIWIKIKNVNNNKMILKDYIRQYWQRCNAFAYGRIRQCMHKIAYIYIVVPQQKWNNTYLETSYKLDGGKYCKLLSPRWKIDCYLKELTKIRIWSSFK